MLRIKLINQRFPRLNIDSELWKTDGCIEFDDKKIMLEPVILIGLDVIRACNFIGDKDKIELHNFNYEQYENYCNNIYIDSLHLYKNTEVNRIKFTKQDAEAALVNKMISNQKK